MRKLILKGTHNIHNHYIKKIRFKRIWEFKQGNETHLNCINVSVFVICYMEGLVVHCLKNEKGH